MRSILLYILIQSVLFKSIISFADCCSFSKNGKIFNVNKCSEVNKFQNCEAKQQNKNNYKDFLPNSKDQDFFHECKNLLLEYCKRKNINFYNSEKICKDIENSLCGCKKVTIKTNEQDYVVFIKKNNPINTYYIDILKEIGLCNLDYISDDKYLLTSEIDLSETKKYNNFNIDSNNNFDEKILDKVKDIENFKEFCFFCSLLELTDCNPFHRLDNCCILNNRLMLLDINKIESFRRVGMPNFNQFFKFVDYYKKKNYFYFYLNQNTHFPFAEIYDETYFDYVDSLDLDISALMFVINQYCKDGFFVVVREGVDFKESEIVNFLKNQRYGDDLEMLLETPNAISSKRTFWRKILGDRCKTKNIKKCLRFLFLEKFNEVPFTDFVTCICKKIWEKGGKKNNKMKCKYYEDDVNMFCKRVNDNLEKSKNIIKAYKKYYDCEKAFKDKKFYDIMVLEDFTKEEKENIINKLKMILNYLAGKIQNSLTKNVYEKIADDLLYRLKSIESAFFFNFLFEDSDLNVIIKSLAKNLTIKKNI